MIVKLFVRVSNIYYKGSVNTVKIKKIMLVLLSICLVYVPFSVQYSSVNVKAGCTTVLGERETKINTKTNVIELKKSDAKIVKTIFPNGRTVNNKIENCIASIGVPSDIKLTVGMKIKFIFDGDVNHAVIKTVRPCVDGPIINPWRGENVVTGKGKPGALLQFSFGGDVTGSDEFMSYTKDYVSNADVRVDKNGNWMFKLNKPYKNLDASVYYYIEDDMIDSEVVSLIPKPVVYSISQFDKKISGRFRGGIIRVVFPNGKTFDVKEPTSYWNLTIPKDVVLKKGDRIKVVAIGDNGGNNINDYTSKSISSQPVEVIVNDGKIPSVVYQSNVQKIGWQAPVKDNVLSGTLDKNLGIETIRLSLQNLSIPGGITYSTYVSKVGWQAPVSNNQIAGTVGQHKTIEGIKINLTGEIANSYDIYYRVKMNNKKTESEYMGKTGWLGWAKNGGAAGSEAGRLGQVEGFQVLLIKKGNTVDTSSAFLDKDGNKRNGTVY